MALYRGELERRFDEPLVMPRKRGRAKLFIDFETYCDLDLKKVGLDRYSEHPSCEVLMCSWGLYGEEVQIWDKTAEPMPKRLRRLLEDDDIEVHAFNAQFERTIMTRVLGIKVPICRWRCTMVLAYMHSFVGDLDRIGRQIGLPQNQQKLDTGSQLIKMFCMPQRITRDRKLKRLDSLSNPIEWEMFKEYCIQDNIAEQEIHKRLDKPQYPIPAREWRFYALDQIINDRGMPVDLEFIEAAIKMSDRRKAELKEEMQELTGLINPNSGDQLLPWLKDRGYPFDDLQKDSVKKVLTAHEGVVEGILKPGTKDVLAPVLTDECVAALKLRQQSARTSVRKYDALKNAVGSDGRIRFCFQFAGASRTARFAGRRFQPQNLTTLRLPGDEKTHVAVMQQLIDVIKSGDYEMLKLYAKEPLDVLAGLIRAAIRAFQGNRLVVCDLSSIESVVIGYVARCERLLDVFRAGKDAYKDFATELYKVAYEEVTKEMRKMAKPATLGAGYRLGGGHIIEGKRTGLWGYAENMGVEMSRQDAHKSVKVFRRVYKEIPQTWYELEEAIIKTIKFKKTTKVGCVKFFYEKPYLVCQLPSKRCIYYHEPRINRRAFIWYDDDGNKQRTVKDAISYMGKQQNGSSWIRIDSHGGKFIENVVQAIARDILREGMLAAHEEGMYLIGSVHDEIITEEHLESHHNVDRLRHYMIEAIPWLPGCPLNAEGFETRFYYKT